MLLHLPPMPGHRKQQRVHNGPPLAGHGAQAVRDAIAESITTLPQQLRRSLTWDQGAEMAQHAQLRVDADLDVYFCDPQSPWQRGTNENTNGLLRQYFPKGTDLTRHSRGDLDAVAAALNGRPRKTLGYRTPAEALTEHLGACRLSGPARWLCWCVGVVVLGGLMAVLAVAGLVGGGVPVFGVLGGVGGPAGGGVGESEVDEAS